MCKIIIILNIDKGNISCLLVEFLLKWWPKTGEWLNACVAIKRTWVVMYPTKYSRSVGKRVARWIAGCVIIFLALVCSLELIYRRMVIDTHNERAWCVLTLNADRPALLKLYSISNVLLFSLPIVINLLSSILIIQGTMVASKQAMRENATSAVANENESFRSRFQAVKNQISKHKHILIAPILLGILAVPRLVFAFVFVCTKIDRRPYISLLAYCAAFLPCNAILFAFILPSQLYRTAFLVFLKQIQVRCFRNLFSASEHTT
ncbi:unnamed protein product [Rotaria socialis]|uniref:G-protein coupled receptors family 1 profile domain-containing protein n=1 Tax=Rotaria socialis TaxID=392032 RepID=A0A820RSD0_9BILA|nr:unnamed protein product [Rotaria socialis]CAF3168111.1 unnamed protein product [Rotaria socialis]CAF4234136.1 unnamed protein product [Rotaria socialis]CAF4446534.1 unnamed protein product [Rotaria socialis]